MYGKVCTTGSERRKSPDSLIYADSNCMRIVDTMCNLSVGVFERGIEQGIKQGIERGAESKTRSFVINLLHEQMQVDFIARMAECTEKYVRQVAKEEHLPVH